MSYAVYSLWLCSREPRADSLWDFYFDWWSQPLLWVVVAAWSLPWIYLWWVTR